MMPQSPPPCEAEALEPGDTSTFHQGGMHFGLPPLQEHGPALSTFEMTRPLVFYFPLFVYWAFLGLRHWGLSLPTVANPHFPLGGLIGESKSEVLDTITDPVARSFISPYTTLAMAPEAELDTLWAGALERVETERLGWPVVAKPDIGSRGAGVRLAKTPEDLKAYLAAFPRGHTVVLQAFIPFEAEAGVFYVRLPGERQGRLFSLTLKYFPYVVGDGVSTLRTLIERDPRAGRIAHIYLPRHSNHAERVLPEGQPYRLAFAGSHSRGTIFKDGSAHITPQMTAAFERVAQAMPEFYFGRFDVRFPTIEDLKRGEKFRIIEVNGAGAEATHIWDSGNSLWSAYRTLFEQYGLLYRIGAANRRRGFKPVPWWQVARSYVKELTATAHYPQTE
ncbi:MAG: D-alanine--D-alanine ligase [Alphaproteobacteria bacterium]